MLRALTAEQIRDWFTVGKAVTAVEFLGGEAHATAPRSPLGCPDGPRESVVAVGLPSTERGGTEYAEKYRQVEAQKLDAFGTDQFVYKLDTALPKCEPRVGSSVPISEYKYADMPIAKHKEEIVSLIESNSVVVIQGATGSGKSTQLPQYVLDYCTQQSIYCNIAVTQPRKIGASSIARWISKERSWTLGGFVGYQVSLEKVATKETRLLYMTAGILLQKAVYAKSLTEFTHIFIDEVHERTEEMDFLLLVVRKLLRTNSQSVKVILMSASINCEEIANYFALPVHNGLNPAYVFKVEGKCYDIEEYYLDDLKHIVRSQLPPQRAEKPVIVKEMYEVAVSLIQSFDELEMKRNGENKTSSLPSERGSVLVFLPGLNEISCMHSCLTNMFNKRWQVYPLHSRVTLEEQSNVFLTPVPGYRKIILSTNIAESSVTVPDVKYVIDFCLIRTLVCDEETNYQSLRLRWASKTNCYQRKGRAGRVSNGYCYRLVYKNFWRDCIPEKSVPEILCSPLGATVLKIKRLDMGEPKALLATALSPPNLSDIERTVLHLKELGALTTSVQAEENPHDGELTYLGRVLLHLPVDLHLGKLIVLGHIFGCLEECLIIAAALSLRNIFAVPFKQYIDGYRSKLFFSGNSKSDCIATVNAFKAWQICRQRGELRHPKDELEWGRSNFIHIKKVREVAELFNLLKTRVGELNMFINTQPSAVDEEYLCKQRFILQVVMAGAFYPNYFTFQKCNEEVAIRDLAGKDPKTTVLVKNIPPYGYLYHKQLQSLFRQCGQVKSVLYDGSRAFVEFSHNPVEGFKILPAVYMSIKMLQLKIPLELKVHYPDDIQRQLQHVASTSMESVRVNVDYQKQTVEPVEISFGTSEMSKMIPSHLLSISVTEIVEVGHFWGYRIDEKNRTVLQAITAEINYHNLVDLSVSPYPELLCLAPFTCLENRGYYRARILYVSGDFAEVFFVDYGNRSKVPLKKLKEIPSHLQELPFQQSHDLLQGLFIDQMKKEEKTLVPSIEEEKHLIERLLNCFSGSRSGAPTHKVTVSGPFSPYEVKCYSMTKVSKFRNVFIHKESINSVVVDDAPEDSFQQLLVAASLSVNANGSTVFLEETSLMPPIPGLLELLSMLFAPAIELRIDESGKNFTGVLCGLGWSQSRQVPLLPENDMELTFDVHFGVDDISEINILRTAINKLLCECAASSDQEKMTQLQENIREMLLSLICKSRPRDNTVPKWYEKPYQWNQVDSQHVIDQSEKQQERDGLYQLHKLVVLNV
ncbi:ATP-dependent RNA helicase TDRD9 isoform X3 [Anas platyrhynchos]|uniref:ATP-dependent RNA helicase TDRD9 n=1 Tax=Anas zonorhyncha TaxID=75864 RepID=A0A8B9VQ59_9AVES